MESVNQLWGGFMPGAGERELMELKRFAGLAMTGQVAVSTALTCIFRHHLDSTRYDIDVVLTELEYLHLGRCSGLGCGADLDGTFNGKIGDICSCEAHPRYQMRKHPASLPFRAKHLRRYERHGRRQLNEITAYLRQAPVAVGRSREADNC